MVRRIAIGDIHGCNKNFNKLLFKDLDIKTHDQIFLLGDYIDRGPDSLGVIQTIIKLKEDGFNIRCIRGNHEQLMIDSVNNMTAYFQ